MAAAVTPLLVEKIINLRINIFPKHRFEPIVYLFYNAVVYFSPLQCLSGIDTLLTLLHLSQEKY